MIDRDEIPRQFLVEFSQASLVSLPLPLRSARKVAATNTSLPGWLLHQPCTQPCVFLLRDRPG